MGARKLFIRLFPSVRSRTFVALGHGQKAITFRTDGDIASEIRQWAADNGVYMSKARSKRFRGSGPVAQRAYIRMTADQVFAFKMRWM